MPDAELVERLKSHLADEFSRGLLQGALDALVQPNVNTRVQHFSVSMRELSNHSLETLAPDDDAIQGCSWYKHDKTANGPTRRQRALYASRGGLTDAFIRKELDLDPKDFHQDFASAFKELNKRTHLRPNTVITDPAKIEDFANEGLGALCEIFDVAKQIREQLCKKIEAHLHDEAVKQFLNETIDSLDILGGRYETGIVFPEEMRVVSINANQIRYEVSGSVDVTIHWGAGDDSASMDENFPFACNTAAPVTTPLTFDSNLTEMKVDTTGWHGGDEQ